MKARNSQRYVQSGPMRKTKSTSTVRNSSRFLSSLLPAVVLLLNKPCETNAFVPQPTLYHKQTPVPSSSISVTSSNNNNETDEAAATAAKRLLDKAAQLRAEIASMEGKTVEQVQLEAQEKKQEEADRKSKQEETIARREEERLKSPSSFSDRRRRGEAYIQLPNTVDDMIRQAARAVERAHKDGYVRQTVRFHLVPYADETTSYGKTYQYQNGQNYNVLEEYQWPGGTQQMYREAGKPLTSALLKELRVQSPPPPKKDEDNGAEFAAYSQNQWMPPKIIEQDIWDFDGSALHTAEANAGPSGDIQALVFPNTDVKYIKDIDEISTNMGDDRLFLLINPFWRNLESWSFNLLAPNAKAKAEQIIFNGEYGGYDETYVNLIFQVRGEKCIAIKSYPYDWQIFAMREDDYYPNSEYAIQLGSSSEEPTTALVTGMLNERPEFQETKTMRQFKKF